MAPPLSYSLASGQEIPAVALGTWQCSGDPLKAAIQSALTCGYRHIDCAWIYNNEVEIGNAIRDLGFPRENLFLTSKLWNGFHRPEHVEGQLLVTLRDLGVDYIDLWLMHWPVAFSTGPGGKPKAFPRDTKGKVMVDNDLTDNFLITWREMEKMVDSGKVKSIGVSNFSIGRLKSLLEHSRIPPAVNQVEINFLFPQHALVDWCQERGVLVQAYSPLGSSSNVGNILANKVVRGVAAKCDLTPAQVVLAWLRHRGLMIVPKSLSAARIEENIQSVELTASQFAKLQRDTRMRETQGHVKRIFHPAKSWGLPTIFDDSGNTPLVTADITV